MDRTYRTIFLVLLSLFGRLVNVIQAQDSDKQLQEAAMQSCIDGFVVHRDKIIRTQDSKEMGAKYLTEFDVESRLDCMRACCETAHCDVFIFEEKKPGSCYLFHCGPPHDFKCKFTSHANYSSAVLTDYNLQNAVALEEEIRRNQQEHELKSLRKLEPPPSPKEYGIYFTNSPPSTSTTPAPTTSTTTTTTTTQAPVRAPTCSRNQFECRSGDDCIAIYNVCDGIPQCADGSDEAAELGCPVEKSSVPPPPPPPPPVVATPKPYVPMLPDVMTRYQQQQMMQQQQQRGQYPMMYPNGHVMDPNKGWPIPNQNPMAMTQEMSYNGREYGAPQQIPIQQQQPSMDELGPTAGMGQQQHLQPQLQQQQQLPVNYNSKPAAAATGYQWNPGAGYPGPMSANNNNNNNNFAGSAVAPGANLDVMHAQNALPPQPAPAYEQEQMPRIFNHKGPGIRLEDMEAANGAYNQDPNRVYAPYYPHAIHHNVDAWQEGNPVQVIQPQMPQMPVPTPAPPREHHHQNVEPQNYRTTSTPAPPCDPEKQDDATANNNDKQAKSESAQKKVHEVVEEEKPMPASVVKSDIHKVHELEMRMSDAHLQQHKSMAIAEHVRRHGPSIEELEMSRPKGAVISLALGLSVTAIMAVLIACRMRVVKRRGRGRGHDSYAQDADYLVNGMYL